MHNFLEKLKIHYSIKTLKFVFTNNACKNSPIMHLLISKISQFSAKNTYCMIVKNYT